MVSGKLYDAFITYSNKDGKFVELLVKALENYKIPRQFSAEQRHLNIFRFEHDMMGVDYPKAIYQHLSSSASLVVICSPDSRKSKYVKGEINDFIEINKEETPISIIPVLLKGLPNNEIEIEEERAFPQELYKVFEFPIAKNYRGFDVGDRKHGIKKGYYESSFYSLIADILKAPVDEVKEVELKRKIKRRNQVIFFTLTLVIGFLALALYSFVQKNKAEVLSEKLSVSNTRLTKTNHELKASKDSIKASNVKLEISQKKLVRANTNLSDSRDSLKKSFDSLTLIHERLNTANVHLEFAYDTLNKTSNQLKKTYSDLYQSNAETNRINNLLIAENLALRSMKEPDASKRWALLKEIKFSDLEIKETRQEEVNKLSTLYRAFFEGYRVLKQPFVKAFESQVNDLAYFPKYGVMASNLENKIYPKLYEGQINSALKNHRFSYKTLIYSKLEPDLNLLFFQLNNKRLYQYDLEKRQIRDLGNQEFFIKEIVADKYNDKVCLNLGSHLIIYAVSSKGLTNRKVLKMEPELKQIQISQDNQIFILLKNGCIKSLTTNEIIYDKATNIYCFAVNGSSLYAGTTKGQLLKIDRSYHTVSTKTIGRHIRSIKCNGKYLTVLCTDNTIKVVDLEKDFDFPVFDIREPDSLKIRTVTLLSGKLLVGYDNGSFSESPVALETLHQLLIP